MDPIIIITRNCYVFLVSAIVSYRRLCKHYMTAEVRVKFARRSIDVLLYFFLLLFK